MAGRIRQEDVEAVRQRSDIVKIVSDHLQLRKAGADRFVGLCPFHPEKTPSFSVSPSKQLYHCFGCGEGGDLFRFLQKVEGLSFTEVTERLASEAGITLRYEGQADRKNAGRRQALHRAIGEAAALYHRVLLTGREGAEAREYLARRGIGRESIERFLVGYAPGYPDFLLKRLSRSYSPELLVEVGLVSKDADGNLRDRFRGRVMFPIHDLSANPVGFGARLLETPRAPTGAAKYINSPESPIYRKGSLLYNLHRAKSEATRSGRALLVEGYTDVIGLDAAGVREAVATCGTALGEEHVRLLARFTERLVLAFDSDEAGARAAERAFQFHERYPVDLRVLILPAGQDPADFVLQHREAAAERLEVLVGEAVPLVAYMIERSLAGRSLEAAEDRARGVRHVVEQILGRVSDPVLRERYAAHIADRVGVSVNAVLLELTSAGGGPPSAAPQVSPVRLSPTQKVEREALKLLVQRPDLCAEHLHRLSVEQFATPTYQKVFELTRETSLAGGRGGGPIPAGDHERSDHVQKLLAALTLEPLETETPTPDYARHVFLRLDEFALGRKIDELRRQLERLNPLIDQGNYDRLFEQLVRLEGLRRQVRVEAEAVGSAT